MKADGVVRPQFRGKALKEVRDRKMAKSAADFVRGSTRNFYCWLAELKKGALPEGPPIWICGDCHYGNLGPLADASGEIQIEIRDFDQAVIGNPAHDLIRLGLSLASAARSSNLPGAATPKLLEGLIDSYERAFAPAAPNLDQPPLIRHFRKQARSSSWKSLASSTIENPKPTLPLGRKLWPVTREEHQELAALANSEEMRELATILSARKDKADVKLVDAAYWRKGCSSLGRLRYAVLLQVGSHHDDRCHCLMDIKEAAKASAPAARRATPKHQAERVVTGARQLSPALGERMRAATLMGKPVFIRELLPQDLKIEIGQLKEDEATLVASYLAIVVGKAHSRQMDAATRKGWKAELQRNRSKRLDAPTWLWRSVVELLADHERAYLEHCRSCKS